MSKVGGFITLHRQILDWEWYKNPNTLSLFVHLLLEANFEDCRFQGNLIKRGQLVTSLQSLSDASGLSVREVRTALSHLISTGEVTNKSLTKYRIITIFNYNKYQDMRQTERQTTDKQSTNNRQQYNKNNKNNKDNNNTLTGVGDRARRFTPPAREEVEAYCREAGIQIDVDRFVSYYESNGWRVGRNPMKNWKAAVQNWFRRDAQAGTPKTAADTGGYHQRDYSGETEEAFRRMMEAEA